jgi:hypothetical protein
VEQRRTLLTWLNPFRSERYVLISPLPAPTARTMLAALLESPPDRSLVGQRPGSGEARLEGAVWENDFRLSRKTSERNSFRLIVSGTIEPSGNGSLLRVRFHLHEAVVLVLCMILFFLAVWGTLFVAAAVARSGGSSMLSAALFVLVFCGSVTMFMHAGRRAGEEEATDMRTLLASVLDAREIRG